MEGGAATRGKRGYKLPPTKASLRLQAQKETALAARPPLVGFHALDSFLEELSLQFGDVAGFTADREGGLLVALSWRSLAPRKGGSGQAPQRFSVARSKHSRPVLSEEGRIVGLKVNKAALLEDMAALGEGLVVRAFPSYSALHRHHPCY